MRLTVTNESPTRKLIARIRQDGVGRQDADLEPGESRTFEVTAPNSSVSFLDGAFVEAATPAPAPANTPGDAPLTREALEAMPWPSLRKRAIAAGAPKTVSKADAIELLLKTNA